MKESHIEHAYDVDIESFDYAFACEDMERLLDKLHGVERREVLEWTDDGKGFHRVFRYHVTRSFARILEKVVGSDLSSLTQTMDYDRQEHRGAYFMESPVLGRRFTYRSDFSIEPLGPARCVRKSRITIELRVPLVGSRVEKQILHDVQSREKAEWEAYDRFLRRTWPQIKDRAIALWPKGAALDEAGRPVDNETDERLR